MDEKSNRKSHPIPPRKWQRPWLVDDDLKSDEVIEVGCPDVLTGERLLIKFPVEEMRLFMAGANKAGAKGGLVVDRDLSRDLVQAFGRHGAAHGKPPRAIQHVDYPFKWFIPIVIKTHRKMSEGKDSLAIPGPAKVLIFLAVDRVMKVS